MKLYPSGPMTGRAEMNHPAFHELSEWLTARGHDVYNPADADQPGETREQAIARDLVFIMTGADLDGLVLMHDWRDSPGSRAEVAAAIARGLRLFQRIDGELYEIRVGICHTVTVMERAA